MMNLIKIYISKNWEKNKDAKGYYTSEVWRIKDDDKVKVNCIDSWYTNKKDLKKKLEHFKDYVKYI